MTVTKKITRHRYNLPKFWLKRYPKSLVDVFGELVGYINKCSARDGIFISENTAKKLFEFDPHGYYFNRTKGPSSKFYCLRVFGTRFKIDNKLRLGEIAIDFVEYKRPVVEDEDF